MLALLYCKKRSSHILFDKGGGGHAGKLAKFTDKVRLVVIVVKGDDAGGAHSL